MTTIQQYATQAGSTASQYGGQLATYGKRQAEIISKKEFNVKQVVYSLIAIGVLYWLYTEYQKPDSFIHTLLRPNQGDGDGNQYGGYDGSGIAAGIGTTAFDGVPNESKVLQTGVRGVNVQILQGLLNQAGKSLTTDGVFGNNTQTGLFAVTGKSTITLAEYRSGGYNIDSNLGTGNTPTVASSISDILKLTGSEKIERLVTYCYTNSTSWSPADFSRSVAALYKISTPELQQSNTLFNTRYGKTIYRHYNDMWLFSGTARQGRVTANKLLTEAGLNS